MKGYMHVHASFDLVSFMTYSVRYPYCSEGCGIIKMIKLCCSMIIMQEAHYKQE